MEKIEILEKRVRDFRRIARELKGWLKIYADSPAQGVHKTVYVSAIDCITAFEDMENGPDQRPPE